MTTGHSSEIRDAELTKRAHCGLGHAQQKACNARTHSQNVPRNEQNRRGQRNGILHGQPLTVHAAIEVLTVKYQRMPAIGIRKSNIRQQDPTLSYLSALKCRQGCEAGPQFRPEGELAGRLCARTQRIEQLSIELNDGCE